MSSLISIAYPDFNFYTCMSMCLYVDINQQKADHVEGKRDLSSGTEESRIIEYKLHKTEKGVLGRRRKAAGVGVGKENSQDRTIYKNARANVLHCGQVKKQNLLTSLDKELSSPKFGN